MFDLHDLRIEEIQDRSYTAAFFASGYEQRAIDIASVINFSAIENVFVLGFEELDDLLLRHSNDSFFISKSAKIIRSSGSDQARVFELLNRLARSSKQLHLLVDYSSMSKLWCSAFVSWAFVVREYHEVTIDFVYSIADHKDKFSPLQVSTILPLPWFEGVINPQLELIVHLGLGFDDTAPFFVLDQMEPDKVYSYYARPAAFKDYVSRALESNQKLIDTYSDLEVPIPLTSVCTSYSILSENVSTSLKTHNVCLIPMGPKPHMLANLLVCGRFPHAACINVSGKRNNPSVAKATGRYVCTSVNF